VKIHLTLKYSSNQTLSNYCCQSHFFVRFLIISFRSRSDNIKIFAFCFCKNGSKNEKKSWEKRKSLLTFLSSHRRVWVLSVVDFFYAWHLKLCSSFTIVLRLHCFVSPSQSLRSGKKQNTTRQRVLPVLRPAEPEDGRLLGPLPRRAPLQARFSLLAHGRALPPAARPLQLCSSVHSILGARPGRRSSPSSSSPQQLGRRCSLVPYHAQLFVVITRSRDELTAPALVLVRIVCPTSYVLAVVRRRAHRSSLCSLPIAASPVCHVALWLSIRGRLCFSVNCPLPSDSALVPCAASSSTSGSSFSSGVPAARSHGACVSSCAPMSFTRLAMVTTSAVPIRARPAC
jgi:hypothetical protein